MITQENAEVGKLIAENLQSRGDITVAPVEGTILAALVNAASSCFLADTADAGLHCVALANAESELLSTVFDQAVVQGQRSTATHVAFARNVVSPVVTAMITAVEQETVAAASKRASFEIVVKDLPAPLDNELLRSVVEREAVGSALLPEKDLQLPEQSIDQILGQLNSGAAAFDDGVQAWAASLPTEFFQDLWYSVFAPGSAPRSVRLKSFSDLVGDDETGVDAALAIYLIAQRLENEVPEGTTMPSAQYNKLVAQYRSAAIERMARELEADKTRLTDGLLVRSVNTRTRKITVYGKVYRDWLEKGATPEMLAGMAVTEDLNYVTSLIDKRREELLNAWSRFQLLQQSLVKNESFNIFLAALRAAFFSELGRRFAEEEPFFDDPAYVEKIKNLFLEQLDRVTTNDMADIPSTCVRLVCRSRFFYTDAEDILVTMMKVAAQNPGIDPQEAALIATIEYVARYIASQMKIV